MQRSLRSAIPQLTGEDHIYISIAIDPGMSASSLITYANQQGFDWTFTAASDDFIRAFVDQFGRSAITTPNMVHFVIQPDGTVTRTYQGTPSADELVDEILNASAG